MENSTNCLKAPYIVIQDMNDENGSEVLVPAESELQAEKAQALKTQLGALWNVLIEDLVMLKPHVLKEIQDSS